MRRKITAVILKSTLLYCNNIMIAVDSWDETPDIHIEIYFKIILLDFPAMLLEYFKALQSRL